MQSRPQLNRPCQAAGSQLHQPCRIDRQNTSSMHMSCNALVSVRARISSICHAARSALYKSCRFDQPFQSSEHGTCHAALPEGGRAQRRALTSKAHCTCHVVLDCNLNQQSPFRQVSQSQPPLSAGREQTVQVIRESEQTEQASQRASKRASTKASKQASKQASQQARKQASS